MSRTAIIGSGFAGLAAGQVLADAGAPVEIYEAKRYWGGHTHSEQIDGFTFDEGPHVSFTTDETVKAVFAQGAGEVAELAVRTTNWFHGSWVPHPAQVHLYGLDPELVTACIVDLAAAPNDNAPLRTYADWCVKSFGRTFAETFPFAYTRKYWTVDAADMSTDWIGKRIYPPKLSEVVRGALDSIHEGEFHYLTRVRYPAVGGYQAFMRGLVRPAVLRLPKEVKRVDLGGHGVEFADGTSAGYDRLISTMPLPELVRAIPASQLPQEIRTAAETLLCSSLVLVDIAVDRADLFDHQWFYVYDEDISFSRVHFPHMFAAANAPPGHGSIQAEVYHSRHRPLPAAPASLPERVVGELERLGILRGSEVLWARHREVPYANVVFDHHRSAALDLIVPWLAERGVTLAGRYGEWGYHWTDDSTRSGWSAAARVLDSPAAIG